MDTNMVECRFVIWWEDDIERILPQFRTDLYNGCISFARGDPSQDGHRQSQLFLAWAVSEKKIPHGQMGSDDIPKEGRRGWFY
jgi:hypothetical protein